MTSLPRTSAKGSWVSREEGAGLNKESEKKKDRDGGGGGGGDRMALKPARVGSPFPYSSLSLLSLLPSGLEVS